MSKIPQFALLALVFWPDSGHLRYLMELVSAQSLANTPSK